MLQKPYQSTSFAQSTLNLSIMYNGVLNLWTWMTHISEKKTDHSILESYKCSISPGVIIGYADSWCCFQFFLNKCERKFSLFQIWGSRIYVFPKDNFPNGKNLQGNHFFGWRESRTNLPHWDFPENQLWSTLGAPGFAVTVQGIILNVITTSI